MQDRIIQRLEYEKIINKNIVHIVVERTSNVNFPYYAVTTLKGHTIDGSGVTIEEAQEKCETAVAIELRMNP